MLSEPRYIPGVTNAASRPLDSVFDTGLAADVAVHLPAANNVAGGQNKKRMKSSYKRSKPGKKK